MHYACVLAHHVPGAAYRCGNAHRRAPSFVGALHISAGHKAVHCTIVVPLVACHQQRRCADVVAQGHVGAGL
eukprot:scaffold117166_cov66-Phaeocystis_antarctica.AAC.2